GLNIHPADLEAALTAQPGIRAAAVVACEFAAGPEPVAVVLTALHDAGLDAAVAAANRTLADFQQMRRVLRWPEPQFPYTSTGKLVRRKVAEWARERFEGRGSGGEAGARGEGGKAGDALMALIAEVTGEPVPSTPPVRSATPTSTNRSSGTPARVRMGHPNIDGEIPQVPKGEAPEASDGAGDDSLRLSEDLQLDSLGRVQLQSAIEQRFAIDIDDDAMATAGTVGDLRKLMGGERFEGRGSGFEAGARGEGGGRGPLGQGGFVQGSGEEQIQGSFALRAQDDGGFESGGSIPNLEAPGAPGEGWATQDKNIY